LRPASYSYLNESTGLDLAALTDWQLTVRKAIARVMAAFFEKPIHRNCGKIE